MKKLLAILLAVMLLFSLAACGEGDDNGGNKGRAADIGGRNTPSIFDNADPKTLVPTNYSTGYSFYDGLITALTDAVDTMVEANNTRLESENPDGYINDPGYMFLMFMPYLSIDMAMTSTITGPESESTMEYTYQVLGIDDADFSVQSDGTIKITYTTEDWETNAEQKVEEHLGYSDGSVFYRQYVDGKLDEFCEYISLGNDVYALQNETHRSLVTYKNGEIVKLVHSYTIYSTDYETGEPTPESRSYGEDDFIWGKKNLDESWVRQLESQGSLKRIFVLENGAMTVSGMNDKTDWETGVTTYFPIDPIVVRP